MLPKQTPPPSTWVLTGRGPLVLAPLIHFLSSGLGPCKSLALAGRLFTATVTWEVIYIGACYELGSFSLF